MSFEHQVAVWGKTPKVWTPYLTFERFYLTLFYGQETSCIAGQVLIELDTC